ncbi:hypothetical protein BGZ47_004637 [Haplosporangium gracile]|nr:hypothetical protein BGZ47_004637 [Haplosporangium gracile]
MDQGSIIINSNETTLQRLWQRRERSHLRKAKAKAGRDLSPKRLRKDLMHRPQPQKCEKGRSIMLVQARTTTATVLLMDQLMQEDPQVQEQLLQTILSQEWKRPLSSVSQMSSFLYDMLSRTECRPWNKDPMPTSTGLYGR